MALSPTYTAKGDAPHTQEPEDEENGRLAWLWVCIGWTKPWKVTLESRPDPSGGLSFGYVGTSQFTVLSPGSSTNASVAGSSAASYVPYPRQMYHCRNAGCEVSHTVPSLIDWHCEWDHKDQSGDGATRQGEGSRDPAIPRQEATTTTAPGIHITRKPKVLTILSCKVDGCVEAFVQSEEQGKTKQWPQWYSLAEFRELSDASVVLEEFLQKFS